MGIIPSGAYNNMAFVKDDSAALRRDVPQHIQDLLVDPITSGGLLISLPEEKAHVLVEKLKGVTICNAIVGRVTAKQDRQSWFSNQKRKSKKEAQLEAALPFFGFVGIIP